MDRQGFVYFIGYDDYVKIGFTTDLRGRKKDLQTGVPKKLELFLAIPSFAQDERDYQKLFVGDRLLNEWYRLYPNVDAWLSVKAAEIVAAGEARSAVAHG